MTNSPDADKDANANSVTCLTCGSENIIQIGPRGPAYQCQDCPTEFKLNRQSADADPEILP
jgi:transposase-like protein